MSSWSTRSSTASRPSSSATAPSGRSSCCSPSARDDADAPSSRWLSLRLPFRSGAQVASLIAPPAYVANAIRTRQWSINGLLRATALATVLVGPPAGALVAQLRLQSYATKEAVQAKVQALSLDAAQIEAKDFSLIGAAVGSLFTSVRATVSRGRRRTYG